MPPFRLIPSIENLLQQEAFARAAEQHGREAVVAAARQATDQLRSAIQIGDAPASSADARTWLERRVIDLLARRLMPSLRRVINATGVVVHTNLGRAPLAADARDRVALIGAGYSNLEYDLAAGARGHRHVHAERLLCQLTGAGAAAVVNNNAAATLLVLAALASGREVLVSRGELVEIGGGFRVPDVMAASGASLREVGTTNRTRVADYAAAISQRTALILRVHPSNFRIEGFTERPELSALAALARRFQLPLFEDLGSGWLGLDAPGPAGLGDEPSVISSLASGADLVAFSGDKLLGGPQAGLVLGRADLVGHVRQHALMRALRADKLTYAALEATLALWAQAPSRPRIPVYRMVTLGLDEIDRRVRALVDRVKDVPGLTVSVIDGLSTIGGGSAPGSTLPTRLLTLDVEGHSASTIEKRLRAGDPPVVARIEHDQVVMDLRTIAEDEDAGLARAIQAAAANPTA